MGNLTALNYGASIILPSEGFDAIKTLEAVSKHKATMLYGVPTMFIAYLEELSKNKSKYDTSTLRSGIIAGSNVPEQLIRRIHQEIPNIHEFSTAYGQTETSPVTFMLDAHDSIDKKATTVGKVCPHVEAKIVNSLGEILPWGETGEIYERGYLVMKGYWGDEKQTNETIDKDGWLHSGDLGYLDKDGYLKIIGRSKDMIIRGGENVYPREIEEYFMKH